MNWEVVKVYSRAELEKLLKEDPRQLQAARPSMAPRPGHPDFVGPLIADWSQKVGAILYDAEKREFYVNLPPKPGERVCSRAERGAGPLTGWAGKAGLLYQNSNNSNNKNKRYRLEPVHGSDVFFRTPGNDQAVWKKLDGDTLERWGRPSGPEAKAAFSLRLNVASFVDHWRRDHCLFFTVTDESNLHPTQFARRWNSFLVRNGSWILSFVRVLEPQKQGRPHYHLLVAVPWNTCADAFDWPSFDGCQEERRKFGRTSRFRELRARYKASAAPKLVALWALLRKVLPRYGLGRAELLPIRKGKEAISEYVGKYLEAGLVLRRHSWKGCRRIEYDRRAKFAWLKCSRVFAWNSPGAKAWRERVGEIGKALGVADMAGIRRRLGRRWAYHLREAITLSNVEEWKLVLSSLAERAFSFGYNPAG